jgi:hypothetical protein
MARLGVRMGINVSDFSGGGGRFHLSGGKFCRVGRKNSPRREEKFAASGGSFCRVMVRRYARNFAGLRA